MARYRLRPALAATIRKSKGQNAVTYLLRDEFTTDDAAPLTSPRTCEPGPGTLTAVQTDGEMSIATGQLNYPVQTTPNIGDQGIYHATGFARQAGRTNLSRTTWTTSSTQYPCAWATIATIGFGGGGNVEHGYYVSGTALRLRMATTVGAFDAYGIAAATEYDVALILRGAGAFFVVENTLVWVDNQGATATLYPAISNYSAAGSFNAVRVFDLAAPWDTDNGVATAALTGARSAGDTFTHEADCLIEATITTVPAADQIELRFRIQDATNYWQVTVDSAGALDLDEVVAGVVTQRGTSAGVIANGDRIVVVAEGQTIKVYEANTLRITYALAANFATETDGELETEGTGGAVTTIIAWPRTLSGSALTELQRYTT